MMLVRWSAIAEPQFPWERSVLIDLRERLAEQDPLRHTRTACIDPITVLSACESPV